MYNEYMKFCILLHDLCSWRKGAERNVSEEWTVQSINLSS